MPREHRHLRLQSQPLVDPTSGGRPLLTASRMLLQRHRQNLLSPPQYPRPRRPRLLLPQLLLLHRHKPPRLPRLLQPLPQHQQKRLQFLLPPRPLYHLALRSFLLLGLKLIARRIVLRLEMHQTRRAGLVLLRLRLNGWNHPPFRLLLLHRNQPMRPTRTASLSKAPRHRNCLRLQRAPLMYRLLLQQLQPHHRPRQNLHPKAQLQGRVLRQQLLKLPCEPTYRLPSREPLCRHIPLGMRLQMQLLPRLDHALVVEADLP